MSGLKIDALRLTHEERTEAFAHRFGSTADIADAQLAKVLHGVKTWLEEYESDDGTRPFPSYLLNHAMEQANIKWPTAKEA
jgi:hypothetical protein